MDQFVVNGDGGVYEKSVRDTVTRLRELFPETDATALEANLMLERSHRLLQVQRESQWARYGLTGQRFILLRLLYTSPAKRLSMGEIAAEMHLGLNNVSQLVAGLVRDGLVQRVPAAEDKRVVHALLTSRGREMFDEVFPETSQRIRNAWAPLSEGEQKVLIHLLSRLRMHLLAKRADLE